MMMGESVIGTFDDVGANVSDVKPVVVTAAKATATRVHQCDFCLKTFRKSSDLKRHIRVHTGERPHTCQVCQRAFAESGSLARHMRMHSGERPFACSHCGKQFVRSYNAKKHAETHPGMATVVRCREAIQAICTVANGVVAQQIQAGKNIHNAKAQH